MIPAFKFVLVFISCSSRTTSPFFCPQGGLDFQALPLSSTRVSYLFDLFRSIDVGFKVVGTGSVGLRDYVVLFEGNGARDPMFLQVKQEVASVYAKFLPATYPHQGRRAAEGQRAIQPISDPLVGWTTVGWPPARAAGEIEQSQ